MKKIFGHIFIATILLGGAAIPLQQVSAQQVYCEGGTSSPPGFPKLEPSREICEGKGGTVVRESEGFINQGVAGMAKDVAAGLVDAFAIIPATIALVVLQIVNLLVWLVGAILNFSVQYSIVEFADNTKNANIVTTPWGILRDIANMALIFMLLYAGIRTILGQGNENKKIIVNVVVIAVLINFSMFFTRVIIDTSNIIAITFYDAAAPGSLSATASTGLSEALMKPLQLQNIFKVVGGLDPSKALIAAVMGIIFGLIATFVFAAIALLLIIRFVLLIIVIIFSPLAFAGMILPQAKKYTDQWWETLLGQAFFAPIFFLMAWVVIVVANGLIPESDGTFANAILGRIDTTGTVAGGSGTISTINPPGPNDVGVVVNFIIVITLLITALIMAKEWANKAGGGVSKLTGWATGAAGAASFGLAGRAGRYTLGAASEMAKDTRAYKALEKSSVKGGMAGAASRLALAATDKTSRASFDARGGRLGGILGGASLDAGKAQVGGFEADRKAFREFVEAPGTESHKKRQERARKAGIELGITDNIGAANNYAINQRRIEEIEEAARNSGVMTPAQAAELSTLTHKLRIEAIKQDARDTGVMTPAQAAELERLESEEAKKKGVVEEFEKSITKASTKEIEAIVDSNRELLKSSEFANKLNVQQLEALTKSDKLSETEKDDLKKSRSAPMVAFNDGAGLKALAVPAAARTEAEIIAAKKVERARKTIKALSDSEIEMVDPEWIKDDEFVSQLRQPQVDSLLKSGKFTNTQKESVKTSRRKPLLDALTSSAAGVAGAADKVRTIIKKTDPKVLAGYLSIPGERGQNIGYEPDVLASYTPEILKRMVGEMNQEDIQKLRGALLGPPPTANPQTATWLADRGNGRGVDRFS